MSPWGFLLSVLLLLAYFCTTQSARSCSPCCSFMEGFPGRLRTLREKYLLIQTFYVSKKAGEKRRCSAGCAGAGAGAGAASCGDLSLSEGGGRVVLHSLTETDTLNTSSLFAGSKRRLGSRTPRPEHSGNFQSKCIPFALFGGYFVVVVFVEVFLKKNKQKKKTSIKVYERVTVKIEITDKAPSSLLRARLRATP